MPSTSWPRLFQKNPGAAAFRSTSAYRRRATATAARGLFGNPTGVTDGILAEHAVWAALIWPLVLTAIFLPLSARAYRRLRK
ncbi:hypothetical protein [Corynebacterium halotolerans]|uniref:hypothetical protein n=1 Tax=Corynebacterium halotolerans TaxID=225326 RepID=UPI003CF6EC71